MFAYNILAVSLASWLRTAAAAPGSPAPIVSKSGQTSMIPNWDLQSSSHVSNDLAAASRPGGVDTSSWYYTPSSRCTAMGCLLDAGVYNDTHLWYSDNLNHFNWGQFSVPWIFRNEFSLSPGASGKHYILQTNGITSKADVYLNGHQLADKEFQAGAYGGHAYDITGIVGEDNALLIQAYPTNYNYDFAIGFVDWNPYPPDNGTGVWRNVSIKQTGPVSLAPLNVATEIDLPVKDSSTAQVTLRALVQNMEKHEVKVDVGAAVSEPDGGESHSWTQSVNLGPMERRELVMSTTVDQPKIWWPRQWGGQPLYRARLGCSVDGSLSDTVEQHFGIRKVTSLVNAHNDTIFTVNGHHFQVLGGGYGPDMFLRWDSDRFEHIAQYTLDMGLNAIRLEGKLEQPEMFDIADRLGLMIMPGWECCDKWEAWRYNDELSVSPVPVWDANDYATANASMRHEAAALQTHPSVLAYLIGSDYWPNKRATEIYVDALRNVSWQVPVICSAGKLGYPELLGPSGIKMLGPYDWVPPNYWYETDPASNDHLGAAFGFGSELGAGVGTPELGSLRQFLTQSGMDDLWQRPDMGLFHMSTNVSSFHNRTIYNGGLWHRYGGPISLDDYLLKAQMMDYEATRAEFEGFSAMWDAARPATGAIYWMLDNAWPSLHWNLFDYYLHPGGSYFGSKVGARQQHVAYDYIRRAVWLINHSIAHGGARTVDVDMIGLDGRVLHSQTVRADSEPNTSKNVANLTSEVEDTDEVFFLRLVLSDEKNKTLSRNVYWVTKTIDELDWNDSTWYYTPVTEYVDYKPLQTLDPATISVKVARSPCMARGGEPGAQTLVLENHSSVPAFFIRLNLVDEKGNDIVPVIWSDNYVTLFPHEKIELQVSHWASGPAMVQISGGNVASNQVTL